MRHPRVVGSFYPPTKESIIEQIEKCFLSKLGPGKLPEKRNLERDILGGVVPHAGYIYSGYEAAWVYYELAKYKKPKRVIVIGPNHHGFGSEVALSAENWFTPLGEVEVDEEAVEFLNKNCEVVRIDEGAHLYEHSIEVQLPFLQYIYGKFKFIPICLRRQDIQICKKLAECIAMLDDTLILASSDFSHYVSEEYARTFDFKAIDQILSLDEDNFMRVVEKYQISICGYGAIATCIAAVKKLGAKKAELLKYGTSGDITGDKFQVVAYAGIVFRK
ncbi:MAG: AmmeMemoRadiSam system protein B [Thermoplasmata archaeon]|nr:MAG: AmmeMemoRadiSam system protein B [Thermoplasmata archaeon]